MVFYICSLEDTGHTRSSIKKIEFKCSQKEIYQELDRYLKQKAWINDLTGIARTFVACAEEDNKKIVGYYTLSMSLIYNQNLPSELKDKLPGYPTPAILIGKFAVNQSEQKSGVGKQLLFHAFETTLEVSRKVGVFAIKVDAKDDESKKYYLSKGFLALQDMPLGLYIPISTLKEAKKSTDSI